MTGSEVGFSPSEQYSQVLSTDRREVCFYSLAQGALSTLGEPGTVHWLTQAWVVDGTDLVRLGGITAGAVGR